MAKYLLRAIKQVAVYELTGKEEVVDADTESQLNLRAREFLTREFPGELGPDPSIQIEIKKTGEDTPVTDGPPSDFKPVNRNKINPGAPF
jgi:hypothetical protein